MFRISSLARLGRGALVPLLAAALVVILGAAGDAGEVDQGLADFQQGRFAEAMLNWRLAFAAGDARGALYTGVLYDSGLGVARNYGQAMSWYLKAADSGSAAGAFNVGIMYDAGLGVGQSAAQAAAWYARAAQAGFARAEYNLAMLYEQGDGVARDRDRAIALYERAARDGVAAARQHLAQLGKEFAGTPRPPMPDLSIAAFQRAQQVLLGRGPAAAADAAVLFRRAAEQHNPLAEYDLGYCAEFGLGIPRDAGQAYTWYRRAAADASDDTLRGIARNAADQLQHKREPQPMTNGPPARGAGEAAHADR